MGNTVRKKGQSASFNFEAEIVTQARLTLNALNLLEPFGIPRNLAVEAGLASEFAAEASKLGPQLLLAIK